MNVAEARKALTGPIASIRTPFTREGPIDFDGLRSQIDFSIEVAKSPCVLLTAGDSHYECMTNDEMAQMAQVAAEHTRRRVPVVACDWQFGQAQAVAFAGYCKQVGVDIVMTRPADWANSCTAESQVEFFKAVAKVMPVMVVSNLWNPAARSQAFALQVVEALLKVDNIVAMKDDITEDFARKASMLVYSKWALFAGGGLRNHQTILPFGCDGFMDRHMNFKPEISHRYWKAVQTGDKAGALAVMRDFELPIENFAATFPGGRDAGIHGLMEIFGVCPRWRRLPYHSLTEAEMEKLRDFCKKMKLL